jgi:hypothetical protein
LRQQKRSKTYEVATMVEDSAADAIRERNELILLAEEEGRAGDLEPLLTDDFWIIRARGVKQDRRVADVVAGIACWRQLHPSTWTMRQILAGLSRLEQEVGR